MPARAMRESESGGGTMKCDVPAADEKKEPRPKPGFPFLDSGFGTDRRLVVGRRRQSVESASDYRAQLLDAVQVRRLTAFLRLVVDLVPVDEDLQDSAHAGLDLDRDVISAFRHELVDHPGRDSVVLSRHAVDDFDVHSAFASHSDKPPC